MDMMHKIKGQTAPQQNQEDSKSFKETAPLRIQRKKEECNEISRRAEDLVSPTEKLQSKPAALSPSPLRRSDSTRSMSSSSCYSEDSDGTVDSDNEASQLLAQADSGPSQRRLSTTPSPPTSKGQPEKTDDISEDEIRRAKQVLQKPLDRREVTRGGII